MPPDSTPGIGVDAQGGPVVDPTANVLRLVEEAIKRQDDLRLAAKEMADLRAEHSKERADLERQRLDAIRQVDVAAAREATMAAETRAATLAAAVTASAEALRTQVEVTRVQFNSSLQAALEPIKTDVADLRRVQYEQQGQKASQVETRTGNQWTVGTIIAIVAVTLSLILGAVTVTHLGSKSTAVVVCSGTPIVCK